MCSPDYLEDHRLEIPIELAGEGSNPRSILPEIDEIGLLLAEGTAEQVDRRLQIKVKHGDAGKVRRVRVMGLGLTNRIRPEGTVSSKVH